LPPAAGCARACLFVTRSHPWDGTMAADPTALDARLPPGFRSPPPPARPARKPSSGRFTPYLFLIPAFLIFGGLIVYPLIDGIATSFTDRVIARGGQFVGLQNFVTLFEDPIFLRSAMNSFWLTLWVVLIKAVLGMIFALVLAQPMPFRGLFRALVFLPWAVPGLIAGLAWKWIYDEQVGILTYLTMTLGLADMPTYWLSDPKVGLISVGIAMVWHGLPFYTMMFLAALTSIPSELTEAAAIDGAGPFRRFFSVTLPQMRNVIAITVMLSTIWTFNSFHMVYVLTQGGPANRTQILPTLAFEYGIVRSQLGLGAAVLVAVIPIFLVLIFVLTQRMLSKEGN
jgi:multiple sugar transport system permease protein